MADVFPQAAVLAQLCRQRSRLRAAHRQCLDGPPEQMWGEEPKAHCSAASHGGEGSSSVEQRWDILEGINPSCGAGETPPRHPQRVTSPGGRCLWHSRALEALAVQGTALSPARRGDPEPSKPGCAARRALGTLTRFLQHAGMGLVVAQGSGGERERPLSGLTPERADVPGGSWLPSLHVTQPLVLADAWRGCQREPALSGELGCPTEIPPVGASAIFRAFSPLPVPGTANRTVKLALTAVLGVES